MSLIGSVAILAAADPGPSNATAEDTGAAPSIPPQSGLQMITDTDAHLYDIPGAFDGATWAYALLSSIKGGNIYFDVLAGESQGGPLDVPTPVHLTKLDLSDQLYIKAWAARHPDGKSGSPAPSPALSPTGVVWLVWGKKYLLDTTGVLKGRTIVSVTQDSRFAHSFLALCSDGSIVGWGHDDFGQLGDGHVRSLQFQPDAKSYALSPVLVHQLGNLKGKKIIQLVMQNSEDFLDRAYALCSDGSLFAWGVISIPREFVPTTERSGSVATSSGGPVTRGEPTPVDLSPLKGRKIVAVYPWGQALCSDNTMINFSIVSDSRTGPLTIKFEEVDPRGLLQGKTITQVTPTSILCSDGTWLVVLGAKAPKDAATTAELAAESRYSLAQMDPVKRMYFSVEMTGALAGKKIIAIAQNSFTSGLIALCSDGTLISTGGSLDPESENGPARGGTGPRGGSRPARGTNGLARGPGRAGQAPRNAPTYADPKNTTIAPEKIAHNSNVSDSIIVLSGVGLLAGKTVTGISTGLITCSDGSQFDWNGQGPVVAADDGGALEGKTILAVPAPGVFLFKEPDYATPGSPSPSLALAAHSSGQQTAEAH